MSIKIKTIQANKIYARSIDVIESIYFDGEATLSSSLFEKYLKSNGVAVTKNDTTKDLINVCFDHPFTMNKNKDSDCIIDIDSMSTNELRTYLYENGFDIAYGNSIVHYCPLYRSTGKAKEGSIIFIRDNLLNGARNYLSMGLYNRMPKHNAKIVELSAYMSLPTATAKGYINIPLDNILIVDDEEVFFKKQVVSVHTEKKKRQTNSVDFSKTEEIIHKYGLTFSKKFKKNNPEYELIDRKKEELVSRGIVDFARAEVEKVECVVSNPEDQEIKSVLFDGEGLIDESIFPDYYYDSKGIKHSYSGFIYLRNHFFKSCLFKGKIQQFMKDYYKDNYESATVNDMFGREVKVKDIKAIVTSNSIKWLKIRELMGNTAAEQYKYYNEWLKKFDYEFEIVKTAQKSKYGDIQRSSYQIMNSLPTKDRDVLSKVAKTTIDYCNELKTNHEAFIQYLKLTAEDYNINNILIDLDDRIPDFKQSEFFRVEKNKIISKFKNTLLTNGKLLQQGDNLTLCSNPYELLVHSVGADYRAVQSFRTHTDYIECSTTRFDYDKFLASFRSPHNAPHNTLYFYNKECENIKKYFPDLGDNVIVINSIDTDIQARASGCDFDTDFVFTTDQKEIVELAAESYKNYPTIINDIKDESSCYDMNLKGFASMDNKIASGQSLIGGSSDLAQLVLSYYIDELQEQNGRKQYRNKDYEDIIVICSVLAQIGIDQAKKNFPINAIAELQRLKAEKCIEGKPYPMFFANIKNQKKRKMNQKEPWKSKYNVLIDIEDEKQAKELQCPMDILRSIIDSKIVDNRKRMKKYPKTFIVQEQRVRDIRRDQVSQVKDMVAEYNEKLNIIDYNKECYYDDIRNEFEKVVCKIKKLNIKQTTMRYLIRYAIYGHCKFKNRLLAVLYIKDSELFLSCFEPIKKVAA